MECVVQGIIETQVRSVFAVSPRSRRKLLRFASDSYVWFKIFSMCSARTLESSWANLEKPPKSWCIAHTRIISNPYVCIIIQIFFHLGGVVPSEVRLLCDLDQPEPTWFSQLLCIYSCFYLLIKNLDHRTVNHVGGAMRGAWADQIYVMVRTMIKSKH